MFIQRGHLTVRDDHGTRLLKERIRSAALSTGNRRGGIWVNGGAGDAAFDLVINPLPAAVSDLDGQFALVLISPGRSKPLDLEEMRPVREMFQLTTAEARLVAALAAGSSRKE